MALNGQRAAEHKGKAHIAHAAANNNSGFSLGFVSATQIPAGGAAYDYALSGDFNGDGKKDLITIVQNYINNNTVYSMSVVAGNGDGTFKPAVLTTVGGDDPILVGDVNGDGKDDVVQAHPGGNPSMIDVWLSNGDGTFTQGQSFQVSPAELQGGVLTDLDGDGKLDVLAVDSQNPGLVRTLLGNGDGTFQAATSITLPTEAPYDIQFADFNGDGKVDFAGFDDNTGQVDIYLQAGGNFVASPALTTPDSEYGTCNLATGDLTGDGAAEVVAVNCDAGDHSNTVTVYVNNGDGTFAPGAYYPVVASGGDYPADVYPYAATIADVNGDGKSDIVVTNDDSSDITILAGNGDGTVSVPSVGFAAGGNTYAPAIVADFNGDGKADIVQIDDEYSYAYLQGYGDGTFRASLNYYSVNNDGSGPNTLTVATGDFNGDGMPDFAVGSCCADSTGITIFLSRSDGGLLPGVNYGSDGTLAFVAIADFDGDGKLDVVASDPYNSVVTIFNGLGDGTFTVGSSYFTDQTASTPEELVVGDFNHDGHPDVAVANFWNADIGVLLNDGSGGFQSVVNYSLGGLPIDIAAGDLDGDGYADLLITLDNSNVVAILKGVSNNSGTFQSEYDIALSNGSASYNNPQFITVADFDGDGNLDFATSIVDYTYGNQGIAVALGKGDGTFNTPSLYSTTKQDFIDFDWPFPAGVEAADVNGDGILDLVYANNGYGTVGVLLGNGNGTFGTPNEYPAGQNPVGFALADLNGDGAPDIVSSIDDAGAVNVLLNENGNGEASFAVGATSSTSTVTAGTAATYTLNLTGLNGYTGTVTFSCSGLPANSSCSFSPSSIVASGSAQSTTLTLSTSAPSVAMLQPAPPASKPGDPILWASLGGIGIFGLVLAGGAKRNRRQMAIILGVLLLVMVFSLVGCGGTTSAAHSSGTPAGTYTVVVTATGTGNGAPTHSMNLTLIVQ